MSTFQACIDRQPEKVLYTIVRADIPRGAQVAQTAHAASEASGYEQTIVVALSVPDEASLVALAKTLGVPHKLIVEDAGPHAGQAMAIGINPTHDRDAVRKVTSALPLVK